MDTESKIIELAKESDQAATEALFRRHFKSLYAYIRYKVETNEVAEDICSETFAKAFEKLDKFKGKSSFKTWLYTIAKNQIFDYYKERDQTKPLSVDPKQELSSKTNYIAESKVRGVLKKLKSNYREVLECRYLLKLSIKETAELMRIKPNNVKILQHRALRAARQFGQHEQQGQPG